MKNYEKLKKLCETTKTACPREKYEELEFEILQGSLEIEDIGEKTDKQRRDIDDKKDDRRAEIRANYSSDTWATRMVSKEYREAERPVIIAEEMNKRDEKRIKAIIRRSETVKSRFIKMMADDKRQSNLT